MVSFRCLQLISRAFLIFVNLPRLALLRIELRTLGLPVGCAAIALIVGMYTVDSFMPGFLTRLIYSVEQFSAASRGRLTNQESPTDEL